MVTLGGYLIGSGLTAATPKGGYWFVFLYATRIVAAYSRTGIDTRPNDSTPDQIARAMPQPPSVGAFLPQPRTSAGSRQPLISG